MSASRCEMFADHVELAVYSERTSRTVCASDACACASATSASARSSVTSVWPAFTKSVSSALTDTTVPATCGVICTRLPCTYASSVFSKWRE